MPILHTQFSGQATNTQGVVTQVAPGFALANRGPVIQVAVFVAEQIATQLVTQGKPLQPPIAGFALIDTGASMSCIDEEAAKTLKLPIIDVVQMCSASHAAHPANIYPIQMRIAGLPNPINVARAMGAELKAQGLVALIGRDVLSFGTLFYNGPAGTVTFSV
jgi:predicted aspartyl protease